MGVVNGFNPSPSLPSPLPRNVEKYFVTCQTNNSQPFAMHCTHTTKILLWDVACEPKIRLRLGLHPGPLGGAHSTPTSCCSIWMDEWAKKGEGRRRQGKDQTLFKQKFGLLSWAEVVVWGTFVSFTEHKAISHLFNQVFISPAEIVICLAVLSANSRHLKQSFVLVLYCHFNVYSFSQSAALPLEVVVVCRNSSCLSSCHNKLKTCCSL